MRSQENPPENKRTRPDRLAEVPAIFWGLLALIVVLGFIVMVALLFRHHNVAATAPVSARETSAHAVA